MTPVYKSPDAKVTERFTRISKTPIKCAFAVDDPAVFTQVWKGEIPLTGITQPIFESAWP